ncbi:MAG TPA: outer membrane protein assembly factor BamC [Ideonella sp.]|uniref:outer membrane protein assembly factor BamC n=1 Tax=Ideonella sp. TaxID=1929293 RepID=UPI002E3175AB|nr:outer membrane protein assembly factor BamC [Ideonella sp.]HEX5685192.1 outer membrane protein assembly factor BamC [Ideonella sp.]
MHCKKPDFVITPLRAGVLLLAFGLGGCSLLSDTTPGNDSLDYRSGATKTPTLEVPPDLTPLARDGRYLPQSGSVSASALASGTARPAVDAGAPSVAIQKAGDVHLERAGDQRWIVSPQTPDQLWPRVRQFWLDRGFTIAREDAEAGTLETGWAENRAKLPNDIVRRTIGSVVSGLFDTGERDRFMMRMERGTNGTEIYIAHHGIEEKVMGRNASEEVKWSARPADPQLEREMLTRLMISLGAKDEVARAEVAAASGTAPAPKARVVSGKPGATLEVDDALERAWRRIGLALDRGGFTVEDRDRNQGLYFVRFVDTKEAAKDEPNFFTRWFSGDDQAAKALNRYRIQVKAEGNGTQVTVLNYKGEPDNSANAQKIVSLLADELKL